MKYFSLDELTASETARIKGLDNTPRPEHRVNLETMVASLLDPLREAWTAKCMEWAWGSPVIRITSCYRGFRLNAAVSGASTSAHSIGFAADTVPINGRLREYKAFCRDFFSDRAFDQLISEDEDASGTPRWIHIGYRDRQGRQRRQQLTMRGGKYSPITE